MRRVQRISSFLAVFPVVASMGIGPTGVRAVAAVDVPAWCRLEQPSQRPVACGVNALYVLLRANRVDVDHQRLLSECAVDPVYGTSLTDLSTVARQYGLAVQMLRSDPDHIAELPLPFIAHLEANETTGHYVVVTRIGENSVSVIDGINGKYDDFRLGSFERAWSGYVLVAKPPRFWEIALACTLCGLLWLVATTARS